MYFDEFKQQSIVCLASKLKKIRKLATSSCPFMGEQINFCWVSKFGRKTSLFDAF